MQDEVKDILDVHGAAVFLGFSERSIRAMAGRGEIPAGKLGGEWRFSKRQLIQFIEAASGGGAPDGEQIHQ